MLAVPRLPHPAPQCEGELAPNRGHQCPTPPSPSARWSPAPVHAHRHSTQATDATTLVVGSAGQHLLDALDVEASLDCILRRNTFQPGAQIRLVRDKVTRSLDDIGEFSTRQHIKLTPDASRSINQLVVAEYMHEFSAGARPGGSRNTGAHPW